MQNAKCNFFYFLMDFTYLPLLFGIVAYGVHIVANLANTIDSSIVRSIADICKAHLQVLAIETTCSSLIGELVPVSTNNLWMLQSRANIRSIGLAALLLILNTNQRVVEHALIHRAKVELADNHRLVDTLRLTIVGEGEVVHIVADSIAILRADKQRIRI